eukprot:9225897-Prorocentrum_lima.AAC.1
MTAMNEEAASANIELILVAGIADLSVYQRLLLHSHNFSLTASTRLVLLRENLGIYNTWNL